MRRFVPASILAVLAFALLVCPVLSQDFPDPEGFVNDFAGVLSDSTVTALEYQLSTLEKETSAEVAVVTIESLEGATIEEYAVKLFEKWEIGKRDKDNGVLLILAIDDRDIRIEVGYGLEETITDGRAGRILDDKVLPFLSDNDYDTGIQLGVMEIENYIRSGDPPSVVEENPVQDIISEFRVPIPVITGLGVFTIYILGFMARTRSIWLGGIWGVILGLVLGFGFGQNLLMIILPLSMGAFGLLLDWVLSRNYRSRSSHGQPTGWFSSGGGFRGSGGGFGGFGGGRSGGGGASRGW
jgi:uncharacterized protein